MTPASPPPDFLDAGTLENDFNVSYTPAININAVTLDPQQSPDHENVIAQDGLAVQHVFLAPVPHVAITDSEDQVREVVSNDVIDMPNCWSLAGSVITVILLMMILSIFICLSRSDFNFVLYLMGYTIWCLDSKRHAYAAPVSTGRYPNTREVRIASGQTLQAVVFYCYIIAGAVLLDASWLYLATSAWICLDNNKEKCFEGPGSQQTFLRVQMTSQIHQFTLAASTVNLIGKVIVIILSILWLIQQKRHRKNVVDYVD